MTERAARVGTSLLGLLLVAVGLACAPDERLPPSDAGGEGRRDAGALDHDADRLDGGCPDQVALALAGVEGERVTLELPAGCDGEVVVSLAADALVEVTAPGATLSLEGAGEDEAGWIATRTWSAGERSLAVAALEGDDGSGRALTLVVVSHGPPVGAVLEERSLVWTQPALVDDAAAVGLGRLLAAVAADGHGGRLLEQWLTRFSTTAHSERAGPTLLLDDLKGTFGADVSLWDLDALPFVVTAVHNRMDLQADDACGELRVSLASLHDVWRPLHLIFLFRQPAGDGDVSPGGAVHCHATARRWARLSDLDEESFFPAARELLDEALVSERFLLAESEELTVSPWEWRQWALIENPVASEREQLPLVLENVPLFQTVDIAAVNTPGPLRESFLSFVAENAAALDERRALVPRQFRRLSVRVNSGVPWAPLDLDGVPGAVLATYPQLRQHIETIGCAGCHMAGEFVQTREDRSFSAFYEGELAARRDHLTSLHEGADLDTPRFGALQADPPLTP